MEYTYTEVINHSIFVCAKCKCFFTFVSLQVHTNCQFKKPSQSKNKELFDSFFQPLKFTSLRFLQFEEEKENWESLGIILYQNKWYIWLTKILTNQIESSNSKIKPFI